MLAAEVVEGGMTRPILLASISLSGVLVLLLSLVAVLPEKEGSLRASDGRVRPSWSSEKGSAGTDDPRTRCLLLFARDSELPAFVKKPPPLAMRVPEDEVASLLILPPCQHSLLFFALRRLNPVSCVRSTPNFRQ